MPRKVDMEDLLRSKRKTFNYIIDHYWEEYREFARTVEDPLREKLERLLQAEFGSRSPKLSVSLDPNLDTVLGFYFVGPSWFEGINVTVPLDYDINNVLSVLAHEVGHFMAGRQQLKLPGITRELQTGLEGFKYAVKWGVPPEYVYDLVIRTHHPRKLAERLGVEIRKLIGGE